MCRIHRCVYQDATAGMSDDGGFSNMWCKEADKKEDSTCALQHMLNQAKRQKDSGYLTPDMLGLMDTRLYCAVWGGVNTACSSSSGQGQSRNQPHAVKAHDAFLKASIRFQCTCVQNV